MRGLRLKKIGNLVLLLVLIQSIYLVMLHTSTLQIKFTMDLDVFAKLKNILYLEHKDNFRQSATLWYNGENVSLEQLCEEVNQREFVPFYRIPGRSWTGAENTIKLVPDTREYFYKFGKTLCMKYGTNVTETLNYEIFKNQTRKCSCLPGWYGNHCSIPEVVQSSNYSRKYPPKIRTKPRRIIQAFPFSNEFEMLESRFNEIAEFVDVFMILESNYSAHGDPKPLRLLEKLQQGAYSKYTHKILYTLLGFFPEENRKNGWLEDNLLRNYIATHGVTHQLKNYKHDDIFFQTDADELPKWETLLFLKLHDNYPIPVGIHLQQTTFGYFWDGGGRRSVHIIGVVTMEFLNHVFEKHAIWIRSAPHYITKQAKKSSIYKKKGGLIQMWSFGNKTMPAGWHCSWCCPVECIKDKLVSAQNGDYPRWGDFPEKRNLSYIRELVRTGTWFNDKSKLTKMNKDSKDYAPLHVMCNAQKYKHIYSNPGL